MILSVPARRWWNRLGWETIERSYPAMQRVDWDLEAPERRLKQFAAAHGIELIQTLTDFRAPPMAPPCSSVTWDT